MYLILVFLTLVLGLAERRVTFICLCYMRVYIACSYCVFVLHVRSELILLWKFVPGIVWLGAPALICICLLLYCTRAIKNKTLVPSSQSLIPSYVVAK